MNDILRVSTHLRALGLEKGDVLCIQLPNWTEAVIYTYAASRLGAIVCPITTIYRQRELTFILERTECKIVVVPSVYRGFDYDDLALGALEDEGQFTPSVIVVTGQTIAPNREAAWRR